MALVSPRGKPNEGNAVMGTEGVGFLSVKDNETALGGAVVGLGFVRLVQKAPLGVLQPYSVDLHKNDDRKRDFPLRGLYIKSS